jgi:hypothetical protein
MHRPPACIGTRWSHVACRDERRTARWGARRRLVTPGGRWLTPGVTGIGGASLLADACHEIPTALLPSLLTSTLGAPAAALGAIEGVSDGLAGLARLGGGALADDPQRRQRVALGGYTTTAVLSAATAGATGPWQVADLRAGAWTARGLRVQARNALRARWSAIGGPAEAKLLDAIEAVAGGLPAVLQSLGAGAAHRPDRR